MLNYPSLKVEIKITPNNKSIFSVSIGPPFNMRGKDAISIIVVAMTAIVVIIIIAIIVLVLS